MSDENLSSAGRRHSLAAIIASTFGVGVNLGILTPLVTLILERDGVDATLIGLNAAMPALAVLLFSPRIARLAGRAGTLTTLFAGLGLALAGVLLMPVFRDLAAWFVLRFGIGLALTMAWVVGETWINTVVTERNRGRVLGFYATAFYAGLACGPLIVQAIGIDGWMPFLAAAASLALAALPLMAAQGLAPALSARPALGFGQVVRVAPFIVAAATIAGLSETAVYTLLPLYGLRSGLGQDGAILMLTLFVAGGIAFQFPIGWLADRLGRRRTLLACMLASLAGCALLPFAAERGLLFWLMTPLWGGLIASFYTLTLGLLGQRFEAHDLLVANAAFILAYELGGAVGPALGGAAMDLWDPHGLPLAVAGALAGFLLFAALRRSRGARNSS